MHIMHAYDLACRLSTHLRDLFAGIAKDDINNINFILT